MVGSAVFMACNRNQDVVPQTAKSRGDLGVGGGNTDIPPGGGGGEEGGDGGTPVNEEEKRRNRSLRISGYNSIQLVGNNKLIRTYNSYFDSISLVKIAYSDRRVITAINKNINSTITIYNNGNFIYIDNLRENNNLTSSLSGLHLNGNYISQSIFDFILIASFKTANLMNDWFDDKGLPLIVPEIRKTCFTPDQQSMHLCALGKIEADCGNSYSFNGVCDNDCNYTGTTNESGDPIMMCFFDYECK